MGNKQSHRNRRKTLEGVKGENQENGNTLSREKKFCDGSYKNSLKENISGTADTKIKVVKQSSNLPVPHRLLYDLTASNGIPTFISESNLHAKNARCYDIDKSNKGKFYSR